MTSVVWTTDGDGAYLVESKQHLLMIMQLGGFTSGSTSYTPSGSAPSNYRLSSYRQTVDIDLEDDPNCYPIGRTSGEQFQGSYDGSGYSICNFVTNSGADAHGLFGYANNATLKDIVLEGTWEVSGVGGTDVSSALCARLSGTSVVERIDINGTVSCSSTDCYGTAIGLMFNFITVTDVTVRGVVNATGVNYCGGVVGRITGANTCSVKNLRYVATGDLAYTRTSKNGGNGANAVGGVLGVIDNSVTMVAANLLNAMTGNINAVVNAGGVIGMCLIAAASNFVCNNLVNAMTGSIVANEVGGIFGRTYFGTTSHVFNVMKGDVSGSGRAGGICAVAFTGTITNAAIAMQGDISATTASITTALNASANTVDLEWKTSAFGLTVGGVAVSESAVLPVGAPWAYHPDLPEIPYLDMSATDGDSNVSYVETPFPNIAGNAAVYDGVHDYYTVAHDSLYSPVRLILGVAQDSYGLFKFDTVNKSASESQGLSISYIDEPYNSLVVLVYAYIALLTWYDTNSTYDVYQTKDSEERSLLKSSLASSSTAVDVVPDSSYVFEIYSEGVLIAASPTVTPVVNGASVTNLVNYLNNDISRFEGEVLEGVVAFLGAALNTGDEVSTRVRFRDTLDHKVLNYVDDGETSQVSGSTQLLTPFTASGGSSQRITLGFDDATTEDVDYDEAADQIIVSSNTYNKGDVFALRGLRVSVASLE